MEVINIKLSEKRASIFVEAAIVLPVFFVAMISLTLTIRLAAVEANTMECFSSISRDYAKEMYLTGRGPAQNYLYESRVKARIEQDEKLNLQNVRVENHLGGGRVLLDSGYVDASLMYEVNIALPLSFSRGISFQEHLAYRGFVGRQKGVEGFGFDEMEKSDNPNAVFVFPRAGERYHKADCRIIKVYPVEKILSPALKKQYKPCRLCKSGDLPYGSRVYCFESTGKVYHKGSCTTVDRYVVEMDRQEAIDKGYTPCAYCGGGLTGGSGNE